MAGNILETEVAVVGAGHAGLEAALASARMGVDTILFTMNLDAIANMPCNPSIGGSGKGHLVYEIDALGGEMGYLADACTLQSRTLNLGKGAAIHAKRVQADRMRYRALAKRAIEQTEGLRLMQAEVTELLWEDAGERRAVTGLRTRLGDTIKCKRVIIAAGTFLESKIHVGDVSYAGGPDGMLPSAGLSESLRRAGIPLLRFKTGTPARVARRSIDFSVLELQEGETPILPYSTRTDRALLDGITQSVCHIAYTNEGTHALIRANLDKSAMYGGHISGTGPRYCPSIEDKIVRFADKTRHQLFVEPCGADTDEMYLQGFSTSMPTEMQIRMLHSLRGFENAEVMRYAYAIEYDCADPLSLYPTLEAKAVAGLYGAGQFNGTSGYEEAAAQGLIAGINAALAVKGREPLVLSRSSSYIGTLIDDLVTKGTNEPYRMMTSRSEYRLLLRQDNADLRLSEIGHAVGLLSDERYAAFLAKKAAIESETRRLTKVSVPANEKTNALLSSFGSTPITVGCRLYELLRRPELSYAGTAELDPARPALPDAVKMTVEIGIKYKGYIEREEAEVAKQARLEGHALPADIDYTAIRGLRIEAAQKLARIRPQNLGQASRISGVNPADISVLLIYLGK